MSIENPPAEQAPPSPPPKPSTGGIFLEARTLSLKDRQGSAVFQSVSLYVIPQELVAVACSDRGRADAFLEVLGGRRAASEGEVTIDGVDLAENARAFQTRIGLAPPENGQHPELTVQETLRDAARLSLPRGLSREAQNQRAADVMAALGLDRARSTRVKNLSPLEKRLLSIAVEILPGPALLVVEQAQEPLDAHAELKLARRLRVLTRLGMTVVWATQAPGSILQSDKLLALSPAGMMAWFGPPQEALEYFRGYLPEAEEAGELPGLDAALDVLDDPEVPAEEWPKRYKDQKAYKVYVDEPLNAKQPDLLLQDRPLSRLRRQAREAEAPPVVRQASGASQFFLFFGRSVRLLGRRRSGLLILLAPVLLAAADFLISSSSMGDPLNGDSSRAFAALGVLAFLALLAAALPFSQEIVNERPVYRRERQRNLETLPYVLSKVLLAALVAAYAGLVWAVIHFFAAGMPGGFLTLPGFWITFALLALAGGLIGLVASAFSSSPQGALGLALLLVVPQLILEGAFLPVSQLGPAGQALSRGTPARYGFEALVSASGYGRDLASDPCWQLPADQRAALSDDQKRSCTCLGENIFSTCSFPGVRKSFSAALEQPKPAEPAPDSSLSLPVQPVLRPGETLDEYAREVNDYTLALEIYQGSTDQFMAGLRQYLIDFTAWQRDRSLAIGGAENQLELAVERFGPFFRADPASDWFALAGFSVLMIVLLAGVQRGKGLA